MNFLSYGRDRQVIVVGDVSGKGAPAALYGAMASGTLRSLAPLKLPAARHDEAAERDVSGAQD